jgi:type VI secretion system protein ImpA
MRPIPRCPSADKERNSEMAKFELAALIGPISDAEPCGPDLDETGDPDYLNFMATAEGLIPVSFLVQAEDSAGNIVQKPLWERSDDRENVDFAAQLAAAAPLAAKTRDLRLLTLLAKFSILDKDLPGFQVCLEATAVLLEEHWDAVHPHGVAGDFSMRAVVLGTLDDPDPVILPLRFYPLCEHKNLGTISYRSYMAAAGQVGGGADTATLASIERALKKDADLAALIGTRDTLDGIQESLTRIRDACAERLGGGIVKFEALPRLVGQIRALLEEVIVARDPAAASASAQAAPAVPQAADVGTLPVSSPGDVSTTQDAAYALAVAAEYFSRSEPSNPALLLVRQAQALIGKSFFEVMQLLTPGHVETASLHFGSEVAFDLPLTLLASSSLGPVTPSLDAETASGAPVDGSACQIAKGSLAANSRQEAVALLGQVGAYFRAVEPSSPIPLLTDRARSLTGKDFMALLGDVLPKSS